MKATLTIVLFLFFASMAKAQLSGYYSQDFEGSTFSPGGWSSTNVAGAKAWARNTTVAHGGNASAYIGYESTGGEDWLITPQFSVTSAQDSLIFWMRLAHAGTAPDSLVVKLSGATANLSDFTTTLLVLNQGNYPGNTSWYRYGVALGSYVGQSVYLAFRHGDYNGEGLFIDDVALGHVPTGDAAAVGITNTAYGAVGVAITPTATFQNNGATSQTFDVRMTDSIGYSCIQTISNLAAGATTTVSFSPITYNSVGSKTFTATTLLVNDAQPANNTTTKTITIYDAMPNIGWEQKTPIDGGRWANGLASYHTGSGSNDTGYLLSVSGLDANYSSTMLLERYSTATNIWETLSPVPNARTFASAGYSRGKVYFFGGYSSGFTAVATTSVYDIAGNSWTTGGAMPTAVGDYAMAQYADTLFYIIGGYNGSADVNTVQVYNTVTNTWTTATAKTGIATAGARAGIAQNQIVVVGGYSQVKGATQSQALEAIIDPANPTSLTWTTLPAYPGGAVTRLAGGGISGATTTRVYFAAGDPTGSGTTARNDVWDYDLQTAAWEEGPAKPTAVSNITELAPLQVHDTTYLVSVGGYTGNVSNAVSAKSEWFALSTQPRQLAVHMISFTGVLADGITHLNWQAAEDGTPGQYVVEKSGDGITFSDIATVSTMGKMQTNSYTAEDKMPYGGSTWYRLLIVQQREGITYSNTVEVKQKAILVTGVSVAPNPAVNTVSIISGATNSDSIEGTVVDVSGKTIATVTLTTATQLLDVREWPAGTYVLRLGNGAVTRIEKI